MTAPIQKPAGSGVDQESDLIIVEGLIKHFPIRAGILRRQVAVHRESGRMNLRRR